MMCNMHLIFQILLFHVFLATKLKTTVAQLYLHVILLTEWHISPNTQIYAWSITVFWLIFNLLYLDILLNPFP